MGCDGMFLAWETLVVTHLYSFRTTDGSDQGASVWINHPANRFLKALGPWLASHSDMAILSSSETDGQYTNFPDESFLRVSIES